MTSQRVGIVGYGAMGQAFAERMRTTSGVSPLVYDVDDLACDRARGDGFGVVPSPAELGEQCDFVHVIVLTDAQVIESTTGERGVLIAQRPQMTLLLHSTTLPHTTREVADAAAPIGVHVIDASSSGTPNDVQAGRLVFLVGGQPDVIEGAEEQMLRIASRIVRLGPLGSGNIVKLIKNFTNAAERLVLWEMLEMATAAGLNYVEVLKALEIANASHRHMTDRWRETFDPSGANLVPWCGFNLYGRDVQLTEELAESFKVNVPITKELARSGRRLIEINHGREREWTA